MAHSAGGKREGQCSRGRSSSSLVATCGRGNVRRAAQRTSASQKFRRRSSFTRQLPVRLLKVYVEISVSQLIEC